jgi:hypothetical protein
MSTLEVNKITPAGAGTTVTLGDSGDSIDITSGATVTNFKSTGIDDNSTSTAITIDSSGKVGIGETSMDGLLVVKGDSDSSSTPSIRLKDGTDAREAFITNESGDLIMATTNSSDDVIDSSLTIYTQQMIFKTNSSNRMTIDSEGIIKAGNLNEKLGGGTNFMSLSGNGYPPLRVRRGSDTGHCVLFYGSSGTSSSVGNITTSGSSTTYNTSSDYRLKENVVDITGATERVKQLQPKRFNFIVDADTTVDGFLAHEVSSIVPEAITGTHNEVEVWKEGEELPEGVSVGDNKLDDEGNTIPVYQGIDQSKLVPLLTASLQEAITKIETLETEMTALKARVTTLENA